MVPPARRRTNAQTHNAHMRARRSACPAFVNSGAYMGVAGSVSRMLAAWLRVIDTDASFYDDQGPLAHIFSPHPIAHRQSHGAR